MELWFFFWLCLVRAAIEWSGPGDSWYTFHLTEEGGKKAIEKYWEREKKREILG